MTEFATEIRQILAERGLTSHMNNTKWRELCAAMLELPFPPAYQVKMVDRSEPEPAETPYVTRSHGDWGRTYEGQFGIQFEWIRIIPRLAHHVGMLIPPRIEDCTEELRSVLSRLRLPFVEENGFFTIYGHSKGVALDYPTSNMRG